MSQERISPKELHRMMEEDEPIVVIDVRPRERFAAGHVPGARHIPLATLKEEIPELPKDHTLVTYCGGRTSGPAAAELLAAAGYNVKVMSGFRHWQAAELPTEETQ